MAAIDQDAFDTLTFDCYGTLVDWQRGIIGYLQPVLERHDVHVIDDFILGFFAETEPAVQDEGGQYADVLREVLRRFGTRLGFAPSNEELDGFPAALASSPPFPDTPEALGRLAGRFDLGVISNIDDALFARTQTSLGVEFAHVVTAQQVGAYKPRPAMFEAALARLEHGPGRLLHVAQSLFHDIAPANALGLRTAWIDRNQGEAGAARPADAQPDWAYPSLGEFADAILG